MTYCGQAVCCARRSPDRTGRPRLAPSPVGTGAHLDQRPDKRRRCILRQAAHSMNSVILDRAPHVPVAPGLRGTTDNNGQISPTVHKKTAMLAVGDGPDLCKAVLQASLAKV
jgi:hypothetical protein